MTLEEIQKYEDAPAWAHVTGEISGLFTIDIDPSGLDWAKERKLYTLAHRKTPSGGYHIDVKMPDFIVKNTQSVLHTGVDTRGEGGIALICGRSNRGTYQWLRPLWESPIEFDTLPEPIQESLRDIAKKMERVITIDFTPRPIHREDLENILIKALSRAPYEGRNAMGFWLACRCRDAGADMDMARSVGYEYVSRVWTTNTHGNYEPYTDRMFDAALENAYSITRKSI